MRVSIFGLGYVGCVTAACLAKAGHHVVGVDVNAEKTAMINDGKPPVIEPGLAELLQEVVQARLLRASVSADWAVKHSDVALICVGTPSGPNGLIDTTAIERVAEDIGRALERRNEPFTIVVRSTVLPGTTERIFAKVLRECLGDVWDENIAIAVNPEYMREGSSIADFEHPAMTLVGCADEATAVRVRGLYRHIDAPFVQTSIKVAEMAKYISNAFHALKICFANEVAQLCDSVSVDPLEALQLFVMDRKLNISEAYLKPGFAFGGSCLPKDLRALLHAAHTGYVSVPLLTAIKASNDHQIRLGIDAVLRTQKKHIGIVGLAFKTNTDDLRESPMVTLVENLIGKGCSVRIFDPNVRLSALVGANRHYIETEIPHISSLMSDSLESMIMDSEVIVIGCEGELAARALALSGAGQTIIDLTRKATRQLSIANTVVDHELISAQNGLAAAAPA